MSAIKAIGNRRAIIDNQRFVIACGLLFAVPADRKIDPALDATISAFGSASGEYFRVRSGETCADALARCQVEYAASAELSFYR